MIQHWLKGGDRTVLRQYFVNIVTLRMRYLFSIVRCPQTLSTNYLKALLPIIALKYVVLKS